jgi:3-hydroxybutyryl-CoA dehydrogenase
LAASLQVLQAGPAVSLLKVYSSLEEIPWKEIDLVVEAVPENLEMKRKVFARLVALSQPRTPLTSNSSGIPISQIGRGLSTQNRLLGLHFFLPAHLVPVVEVVSSKESDPAVADWVGDVMKKLGRKPVQVRQDIPGFLANRIQHALMREALSLVERGIATPEDVDTAVRYGFGFRYVAAGPMLQKDLAGLEMHCSAAASIYPDLCNAAEPSAYLRAKVDAGQIGIKSKKGFYDWTEEGILAEKRRYQKALLSALKIFQED